MLDELIASGRLYDFALAVLLLEIVLLWVWRRRSEGGFRPIDMMGQLLAGALLLLAVRLEAADADPRWALLLAAASFPAHLFDLLRRARTADGVQIERAEVREGERERSEGR